MPTGVIAVTVEDDQASSRRRGWLEGQIAELGKPVVEGFLLRFDCR
jgi:hypothetical protein